MDIKTYLSMESKEESSLAIDRILNKTGDKEAGPLSIIGEILAQREEFSKEIEEEEAQREELAEEEATGDSDDGDGDSSSDDGDGEGDGDSSGDDWDDPADDGESEEGEDKEDDKKDDKKDKKDDESESEDKSNWEKESEGKQVDGESADTTPVQVPRFKESVLSRKVSKSWDLFKPLRDVNNERVSILNGFRLSMEDDSIEEEPLLDGTDVAFSKEAIIESLDNMIGIQHKYIKSTEGAVVTLNKSIVTLDERLLNFKKVYARGKVQFNGKLFTDSEVLKTVAFKKDINLRDSLRVIIRYLKSCNDVVKGLPNNTFDNLRNVFANEDFLQKGEVADYYHLLPGFVKVSVDLPEYNNYLKTSPLEFSVYSTSEYKPSEIYELVPVTISEEKDVEYLVDGLFDIIKELAISVDLLKVVVNGFNTLNDELKVIKVSVDGDEIEKLSEVGIDDKLKSFIIFKLIVETLTMSVKNSISSVTGFIDIIEHSLMMKDIEEDKPASGEGSSDSGGFGSFSSDSSSDDGDDGGDGGDDDWGDDW